MDVKCVIPARFGSSRFPGKPLATISDMPMIYWVWKHCSEVSGFSEVLVATDDCRIKDAAESFGAKVVMTPVECGSPTERLKIVSDTTPADFYVMVNGDEPLLTPEQISKCIPDHVDPDAIYVQNLMTECKNGVEVIDVTNIKVVTNAEGFGMYVSRSPVPYPKGHNDYKYQKFVGVTGFTKAALDYYCNTAPGILEKIEDVDELRFIENGKPVRFVMIECLNCSVDTKKDIEIVEKLMKQNKM